MERPAAEQKQVAFAARGLLWCQAWLVWTIPLSTATTGRASTNESVGRHDPTGAVEFLAGMAGDGRVLELAIGTGRVALPLAGRGVTVEGIDASAAMVERLRAKPGGALIPVIMGDIAEVSASGPYRLVYLVFNSLFNLLSQDRQAECFRNVARVLQPGGLFVIECFVPDPSRFDRGHSDRYPVPS